MSIPEMEEPAWRLVVLRAALLIKTNLCCIIDRPAQQETQAAVLTQPACMLQARARVLAPFGCSYLTAFQGSSRVCLVRRRGRPGMGASACAGGPLWCGGGHGLGCPGALPAHRERGPDRAHLLHLRRPLVRDCAAAGASLWLEYEQCAPYA